MTTYTILNTLQQGDTLTTEIEILFDDGSRTVARVPHFMPKDPDEVLRGISNFVVCAERTKAASAVNLAIENSLAPLLGVPTEPLAPVVVASNPVSEDAPNAPVSLSKLKILDFVDSLGMFDAFKEFIGADARRLWRWNAGSVISMDDPMVVSDLPAFAALLGIAEADLMGSLITACRW